MNRDGTQQAPGAQREWTIGIAVVIAAVLIALAVAAYLTFWHRPYQNPTAPVAEIDVRQVCLTGLVQTQRWGILPDYTKLASSNLYSTKRNGRYVCATETPSAKYAIVVDLLCGRLGSDKCVKLVGVSRDDGAVLFKNLH